MICTVIFTGAQIKSEKLKFKELYRLKLEL